MTFLITIGRKAQVNHIKTSIKNADLAFVLLDYKRFERFVGDTKEPIDVY